MDENIIKEICKEYNETKNGIEVLCRKYHLGKKKIKEILLSNNVVLKRKGGQKDKKENSNTIIQYTKFPKLINKEYIIYDKLTNFESRDYLNKAGILTNYIHKQYNITIPSLYERKKFYEKTGKYWWEQWLNIKTVPLVTFTCPLCDWTTKDINNNSGAFEQHLHKSHNLSKIDFLIQYPEYKNYFVGSNNISNLQFEINKNKFVTCLICGKKLSRIDNKHLKKHNITLEEYKKKYNNPTCVSNELHDKLSKNTTLRNIEKPFVKTSKAEVEIKNFINDLGFECCINRKILNGQEIDIFIPSLNIGFEYNGLLWHTEKYGKDKYYHLNKLNNCSLQGVNLYQIFEDEYELHKDIILNKIRHILHKNISFNLHARKCIVREIDNKKAKIFLDKFHIQGFANSKIYLGAFYKEDLIAVMSFKNIGLDWELNRFATSYDYHCRGIGGKLFNYFIKNYKYNIIKSFADRRWTITNKNLYTEIGFELDKILPPDYYYYNSSVNRYKRFHKFLFRKQILAKKYNLNINLTEKQMTEYLGYSKIWNCGYYKYIYKNKSL